MPDYPDTLTMLEIFRDKLQRLELEFEWDPTQETYAELKYWRRKVADFEFKKQARLEAGSASQHQSDASQQQ